MNPTKLEQIVAEKKRDRAYPFRPNSSLLPIMEGHHTTFQSFLPESQLDRFLMRLGLGAPDRDAERALLQGVDRREMLKTLPHTLSAAELHELQAMVRSVHVSEALLDYLQDILAASRAAGRGLSPRAGLALLAAARAWALLSGRPMVLPEDVQAVAVAVMGHRLEHAIDGQSGAETAAALMAEVPVP